MLSHLLQSQKTIQHIHAGLYSVILQDKEAVSELFREVAAKIADRPGGYTRILKTGNRLGDNAEMCIMELVDYNEAMLAAKEEAAKPKKRRSRRGGAKKDETPVAETKKPAAKAKPAEEVKVVEDVTPVEETEEEVTAETAEETKSEDVSEETTDEADSEEEKKEE